MSDTTTTAVPAVAVETPAVAPESPPTPVVKPSKGKKGKKAEKPTESAAPVTGEAKKEEPKAEAPVKAKVDAWGSRQGTIHGRINALLMRRKSAEPISMDEIMTALELQKTHYNHLNRLVEKGFMLKTGPGEYVCKHAKKKAKPEETPAEDEAPSSKPDPVIPTIAQSA